MAKENYGAWHINAREFSDSWADIQKLTFFARYAILAPSGHNTQPWHFIANKQILQLRANHNRRLPYSGIQANEPYVSLGTCLGTLQLAAKGFGYSIAIEYLLNDTGVASIKLSKKITADPTLLEAIVHRVSNRNYYEQSSLPENILRSLTESELKNVSTHLISERDDISSIAKLTTQATITTFTDKGFRAELSKWVRSNITRQHDGMPGFAQGIPTPVSLFAKHIIKRINVSKDQAKKDSNRVLHSGNLIIITIRGTGETELMDGGRMYAQICVLAQQQNIASTGVGAAIIDPETTKEIIKKFNLPGKPIAIVRLGKTDKNARHTPRWTLASVSD